MPASTRKSVGSRLSSKMTNSIIPSSRHSRKTHSRKSVNVTKEGEGEDREEPEVIDLIEEDEDVNSEDGHSEDEDQVTETEQAHSKRGKAPVFHHEIYDRLVQLMSKQGAYTHEPREYGYGANDITSFHPDQRDWSSSRAHRAPILTLWSEPPGSAPTYPIGYLLFNGRLMLDYAGNPIRAFRNLPLAISSAVKGFRLETWIRQDMHRLRFRDILARLRTRNTPNGREPLQTRGDISDRANAFRLKSGLISFRAYNEPSRIAARAYIDSLRTPAQRANNQAMDRDLTAHEFATLKDLSRRRSVNAAAGSSPTVHTSTPATGPTPTITTTATSRPTRRNHPSLLSRSAPVTPSTSAPAHHPPDSRDAVPKTCAESYALRDALRETVSHFFKLTHQNPKHTDIAQSYSAQWNALQAQFAPIWKSQRPAEETPLLFKLGRWTGGIGRWDDDWRVKVGGEERDREGEEFGRYMDATQEGTARLGPNGTWRSVRDTWCNSHRVSTETSESENDTEDGTGDFSSGASGEGSGNESDNAE